MVRRTGDQFTARGGGGLPVRAAHRRGSFRGVGPRRGGATARLTRTAAFCLTVARQGRYRSMAIPIFRPTLKRRDMGSVLSCIVSDKLGPGDLARDLVARVCQATGRGRRRDRGQPLRGDSRSRSRPSASRAGDGVVLSALAPAVHLRAIRDRGLVPLLADVDPECGVIDPAAAAGLAARGAKAVIAHHALGFVADLEALRGRRPARDRGRLPGPRGALRGRCRPAAAAATSPCCRSSPKASSPAAAARSSSAARGRPPRACGAPRRLRLCTHRCPT